MTTFIDREKRHAFWDSAYHLKGRDVYQYIDGATVTRYGEEVRFEGLYWSRWSRYRETVNYYLNGFFYTVEELELDFDKLRDDLFELFVYKCLLIAGMFEALNASPVLGEGALGLEKEFLFM